MVNTPKQQKTIEEQNKKIEDAILISQLAEHKGFETFNEWLEDARIKAQNPDIQLLTKKDVDPAKELFKYQGKVDLIFEIIQYFNSAPKTAEKPRRDPKSGELEVMNKKK